jgi:hypothetical protein
MRDEQVGHTLQATALVNEVYLRLIDAQNVQMGPARSILRHRGADDAAHLGGRSAGLRFAQSVAEMRSGLNVDEAPGCRPGGMPHSLPWMKHWRRSRSWLPARRRSSKLRYFGGLSEEETADVLKASTRTGTRLAFRKIVADARTEPLT